ncbi:MAG: MaoC/PaaZ C-terminal domain-containing protein, partial [Halobacteriales archaeon]|nr:MaoC/PaaZ C-terminal domain-containing protein [Halobacteriales archaeon]
MTERTIVLSQSDFDRFADISGDHNPIHVDPLFSRRTRFDGTVAHGMMLFGLAVAEASRAADPVGPVTAADLVFPSPTYADRAHVLTLEDADADTAEAHVSTAEGVETAAVRLWFGGDPGPAAVSEETAERLGPLTLGDSASITRTFSEADNEALGELMDDPRLKEPGADLSPVLIGGLVSTLLGTRLPGHGTN